MFETLSSWQFRQFLAVLLSTKRRSSKIISTYDIFHRLIETFHITNFFPLTCNHSLPLFARVQMRTAKEKFFFTSFNKTKQKTRLPKSQFIFAFLLLFYMSLLERAQWIIFPLQNINSIKDAFHSLKNSGLNFRKSPMTNEHHLFGISGKVDILVR